MKVHASVIVSIGILNSGSGKIILIQNNISSMENHAFVIRN